MNRSDTEFIAQILAAYERNGAYVVDGIDLTATDIDSRRAIVGLLERASHHWWQMGRSGHHAYSYPLHARLIRILHREIAELHALENRRAAA